MQKLPFVGRKAHKEKLNRLLKKKTANLVVIRGRRRIGKSRLVEDFAQGLPFFEFTGLAPIVKTTAQSQRNEFARQIQEQLGLPGLKADDWGDLFTILAKYTANNQCIILLDEITWMGSLDPTFLGKLKIAWDIYFKKNPQLILILCGSVSAWIEKNIISNTGFFGRISLKILLEELSLPNCKRLLEEVGFRGSLTEMFMLLSITGGVPWYLELIDPSISAIENIKQLCFEKDGILLDEFKQVFYDLFGRRSEIYQNIVRHLVKGPSEYKEISHALNYPSGGPLSEYLNDLVLSGFIARDHTWSIITGKESNLFQYRLKDNYLRFYLKYIEPNFNKIQKGHFTQQSLSELPGWNSIMGFQFENLVLNNRSLIQKRLNINPADIVYDNPFFQHKTTKQVGCQIDYLIQTRYHTLYVCEVKFYKKSLSPSVIDEVKEKISRFKIPKGFSCIPVLIHVNGVSESVEKSPYFLDIINFSDFLH